MPPGKPDQDAQDSTKQKLYGDIIKALQGLEYDVAERNAYMNKRYRAVYQDGIYHDIDIPAGEWFAEYNLVARVVDIMVAQLFGRGFTPVSNYSKEDLSAYEGDPEEQQAMKLKNKKLKADADLRQRIVAAIIDDNGGMGIFENGGKVASSMGMTAYKMYLDRRTKKIVISLLEKPQNLRFGWKGDNFREWDYCAYVYQISVDSANRLYKNILPEGQTFQRSQLGAPLQNLGLIDQTTVYGQAAQGQPVATDRPMVTVVDLTGHLPGWGVKDGKIVEVDRGDEKPFSVLCVGGYIAEEITDEDELPKYYKVDNRWVPGQSFGDADISDSLIDINKEIVRLMRDMGVWADKNLWKVWLGKGMTPEQLKQLRGRKRQSKALAVSPEQSLEEVGGTTQAVTEFIKLVEQKIDMFTRLSGVSRVMMDDPSVNANSNQALMTTLKPVIDIVESKQKAWTPELKKMFRDALILSAKLIPELRESLEDDPNWTIDVEWAPVLRREDATYQTMLLNQFNAKAMSLDTYLQKAMGVQASEEIDRLRDNYSDPLIAAILGGVTNLLATNLIQPPVQPGPQIKTNVNIKADAAMVPGATEALVASAGAQPAEESAQEQPVQEDQSNPQLTADQNTGQSASQPGSGAPAVSPEGAVAQANQNAGR